MPNVTNKQYVAQKGLKCPVCLGKDMSTKPAEIEAGKMLQNVTCLSCGNSWTDVYKLESYEIHT